MDPATIAMFGVLASLSVGTIWNQQRESRAIREEFTRQLEVLDARHAERLAQGAATLDSRIDGLEARIGRLEAEVKTLRSEAAENSRTTGAMLFDITKRLGRIEGRQGLGIPSEADDADEEHPDSDAA